jgi:hypothetical protein
MATDGVKIIDGDLAFDIYSTFYEMYNKGESIDALREKYEADKLINLGENVDYEICITAYALAFWEIGELTSDLLNEAKQIIAQKATVVDWTNEIGDYAGKARQRELDKFLKKISEPPKRPKKRKKAPKSTLSEKEKQFLSEAPNLRLAREHDNVIIQAEQLLEENPKCHEIRYELVECLSEKPSMALGQKFHTLTMEELNAYKSEHTDWKKIEDNCKYMISHRDCEYKEFSETKKKKMYNDWALRIYSQLYSALKEQKKYTEAIKYTEDLLEFISSFRPRNEENYDRFSTKYRRLYECYYLLNDFENLEKIKQRCKNDFPFVKKWDFEDWEKYC